MKASTAWAVAKHVGGVLLLYAILQCLPCLGAMRVSKPETIERTP